MCLFGSCAPVHTQKNLMWCFVCWPGPGESQSLNVTNSSYIFDAKSLTRSAFPPSLHRALFYQMGVVRSSCSFSLFSSDHFRNSPVSPRAIIITGVWGAVLCSAILTLTGIFSMVGGPCSHVELGKKCVLAEVGSVGSDCRGGILPALYSIRWAMQLTRWTVPWSRRDLDSNSAGTGSEALSVSRCCSFIHVWTGIAGSICMKLRSLKSWPWRVHLEWQHLAGCRKVWPSLSWLLFPGLGLPPVLSAGAAAVVSHIRDKIWFKIAYIWWSVVGTWAHSSFSSAGSCTGICADNRGRRQCESGK